MSAEITPERWRQVDQLLGEALELETAEIPSFLTRVCDGDDDLRRELESLLDAHQQADTFIEAPPQVAVEKLLPAAHPSDATGQMIGPYRVLGEIGRGGMGVVYKAVRADDEYRKEVAIKLVWTGPHNTHLIKRFRRERQILANLEHPNIARLLDGGTSEQGLPYVVMEYIEGRPITDYCRERRLSITERLQLFRDVCAAVQYAHQALVIHRDLKPSNILVTADGKVKLLDFGVAKLIKPDLVEEPFRTQNLTTGGHLMTPEYASPEQALGEAITTASDVYSLGVVLYELLVGAYPYQLKSHALPEVIRAVTEQEVVAPSVAVTRSNIASTEHIPEGGIDKLRSRLRGDLDTIVLTALNKDVNRRYRSVEQLSEDINRHLTHQPIAARNPTLGYRIRKLVRRQRAPIAAAALVFLSLLGGVIATANQSRIARSERAKAESHAQEALRQRAAAEAQAEEARKQQSFAEANAAEANHQRLLAEELADEMIKQQRLAEESRQRAEAGEASYRRLAYTAEMHMGAQHWEMANIAGLSQVVNNHIPKNGEPDLRGFEWYYLWRLLRHNGERMSLQHQAEVWAVAYSPDGKMIATGHSEDDDSVKLWDAATGGLIKVLKGANALPWSIAFSPEGAKLAGAFNDRVARVWDVASGRESLVLSGHRSRVTSVAFSPDGKTIATGSDDETVKLWDAATGRERLTIRVGSGLIKAVAFSPDGKLLATGGVGSPTPGRSALMVKLWRPVSGEEVGAFDPDGTMSLAFSPDGKTLVTGVVNVVRLWDVASRREIATLRGHNSRVRAVAFAPNGRYIASASDDRTAKLWDVETRQELVTLKGHRAEIFATAFSPDGRSLVTGAMDFTAKVWDIGAATELTVIRNTRSIFNRVAFAPDGRRIATGESTVLAIRDAQTGRELVLCKGHAGAVAGFDFSPDGRTIATVSQDRTVRLWDAASGKELFALSGHTGIGMSVAFSPDGRKLVSSGQDQTARVWDLAERRETLTLKGHVHPVTPAVAFTPDGRRIVTGSYDKTVKLWDAATGKELATFSGQVKPVMSVAVSPDGKLLAAGSADTTVKLWELATGREVATLTGSAGHVRALAFSPDGKRLATGSGDGVIRLWDPASGQELIALRDHLDQVNSVSFSPDGQTLASATANGPVRLWRAAQNMEMRGTARER